MKKICALIILAFITIVAKSQPLNLRDTSWEQVYRGSSTKINDLINTKLEVKFDYDKSYMYGKEWVTIKPHFYPTDSLSLDAKGMDLHTVAIVKDGKNVPLNYDYDGMILRVHLDRSYKYTDKYT